MVEWKFEFLRSRILYEYQKNLVAGLGGLGGRNLTIVNNVRRSRLTKSNVALDQDDHSTMTFGHVQKSRQKTDKET